MRRTPIAGSPLSNTDLMLIEQHLPTLDGDLEMLKIAQEVGMSVDGLIQELQAHKTFLTNVRDRFFPALPVDQTPEHIA